MLDINALFDESYYLLRNTDVANAVSGGSFSSGLEHFQEYGQFERHRNPSAFFDTSFYLELYPDVSAAVERGNLSAIEHFIDYGQVEGRDPITEFNSSLYLAQNADVNAVIQQGGLSAYQHFLQFGQFERRDPGYDFNTSYYLQQNPDVASAIQTGGFSAFEHYIEYGITEGRLSSPQQFGSYSAARNLGNISSDRTISGFVGNSDPEDVYRFTLNTNRNLALTLDGLSSDADLRLLRDSNGNGVAEFTDQFIASSVAFGNQTDEISRSLPAGTYFAIVDQFSGNTNYNLRFSTSPNSGGNDGTNVNLTPERNLGTLSAAQTLNGFVGDSNRSDVYRFDIDGSRFFNARLNGLISDADLFLYQDFNRDGVASYNERIAFSLNISNQPDQISRLLTTGTYFVEVEQYRGSTFYNLSLSAI